MNLMNKYTILYILFYIIHAIRQTSNHNAIIIFNDEDTDVIVLSFLVSHIESGVLCIRRLKSNFYCNKLCSPEIASIIVQLHVLTGSDSTSGVFGRGKNAVVKNVLKNIEDAKLLLDDLGKSLTMPEAVYKKIILFVLRYVYNDKKSLNIAESRSLVWRRMKKKLTQRLPPDEDTLRGHIQRCNYVIFMNLHYNSPCAIESPSYHGWISQDGVLFQGDTRNLLYHRQ